MIADPERGTEQTAATAQSWFNRNIITLGLVSFFTDFSSEMLYPLVPVFLRTTLRSSPAIIGVIEGIAEGTANILKTFSGWFSDYLGRRKPLVTAGYSLSSLSKPLLAVAPHWGVVLTARVADRFGKGIRTSARDALIAESCPPEERGKAYGFHRGMDTLGACVGPLVAIPLLAHFRGDFRPVFLLACLPAFVGAGLTLLAQETANLPRATHPPSLSLRQFNPTFKAYVGISVVFALANSSDAFLILRAQEIFAANHPDWSDDQAVQVTVLGYALYNFVYAMLSLPAGALSDRIGQRVVLIGGFVVYGLVYGGWAVAGLDSNLWVLFLVYGIFRALTQGVGSAYAANLAGKQNRGTAVGIYNGYTGMGTVIASVAAGHIWKYWGAPAMFACDAIVAIMAAVLMSLARVDKPREGEAPEPR